MLTKRTRQTRRLTALSVLLATVAIFLSVAPANASANSVACNGSNTVRYTPPLTNQPQDVTNYIDIDWNFCASTGQPGLMSGSSTGKLHLSDRSCLQLVAPSTQTITITWNTGQTSKYTSVYNASIVGAVYTVTGVGTVSHGLFKDHVITTNFTGPALDILTCTAGLGTVSKISLVGTLVIAPV